MKLVIISAIWCSGCLKMKKIWKELEQDNPGIEFQYLDYDMDFEVKNYEVGNVLPVAIFFQNEQEKNRWVGENKKETIQKGLNHE